MMEQQEFIDQGRKILKEHNVEGEIFLVDSRSTRVSVSSGTVENLEERQVKGCGVRVLHRKKMGFSYFSDWNLSSLQEAVERASAFSHLSYSDDSHGFPEPSVIDSLDTLDPSLLNIPTPQKIQFALAIEEGARSSDQRIERVKSADYKDFMGQITLANTHGIQESYRIGRATGSIELSGTDGTSSYMGYHHSFGRTLRELDAPDIGRTAAMKAVEKFGSREFKTATLRVVFNNETTANLFAEIYPLFSAKNILKKKSILVEKLGLPIGSRAITLIDDGRNKQGFLVFPFDGEGTPTRETVLIREGVLENYLHNHATARKMTHEPAGNSVRGSYTLAPKIGITNLYTKPSTTKAEELLHHAHKGVYITELLGLHTIDTITGDFSVGASGRVIENGQLSYPIHQIALSGNILDLLQSVEAVADDLKFFAWSGGGVSMLLKKMTVSGS
jgi:PmbA protein